MKLKIRLCGLLAVLTAVPTVLRAQDKRSIVPTDCVTVRYPWATLGSAVDYSHAPVQINLQQTLVAYIVKSANISSNTNDMQLYVKDLSETSAAPARLITVSSSMSHVHWLEDGRHVLALMREDPYIALVQVDTQTGKRRTIVKGDGDIEDYSVDRNADVVAFSVKSGLTVQVSEVQASDTDIATGFRIPYQRARQALYAHHQLFITRRSGMEDWSKPERIRVMSPDGAQLLSDFIFPQVSLSPNGKSLLVTYNWVGDLPEDWEKNPSVKESKSKGGGVEPTVLYNVATGRSSMPMKSPQTESIPLWAKDSRSYVVIAPSPVGSESVNADQSGGLKLFWIEPSTGRVETIAEHDVSEDEQPLFWGADGELLLRTKPDTISSFVHEKAGWRQTVQTHVPLPKATRYGFSATSDGKHIVGAYMDTTTPPELILFERGWKEVKILEKLNPQFDTLTIAPVETVHWKTSTGYDISGLLLKPIDYVEGVRYPLVIQTKEDIGSFLCDSGVEHFPSFAPQPLANAGIMYLIRTIPDGFSNDEEENHYPKGYPGNIGEAAFSVDIWDSAVNALDQRGLIDRNKVGIIGFSRAGWYTQFALAHAQTHYKAATTTDNVMYSMGTYWYAHIDKEMDHDDDMYGGPPYGKSFKNWLDYSVSFNLDKFHTPLLMEEMGYGKKYDDMLAPPANLATAFEVFAGLNRLAKPVELYYYPNEHHLPEHPQARLATLQRNLDWYRFWLQGFEDPDAAKVEQYARWREMRKLQEQNHGNARIN
jgi:dipeptidyl aminopeptidase/acylaminoacyl peptidase